MLQPTRLPVLATIAQAWRLLWHHRLLHAKAIWPPVVFLVAAEFIYHRIFGNADSLSDRWQALLAHPWWMPLLALLCWLAGLKFLLSFSISWRRHLLLRERFDPFFFKAPFWKYLGLLVVTYVWVLPLLLVAAALGGMLAAQPRLAQAGAAGPMHLAHSGPFLAIGIVPPALAALFALWVVIRQVPFFNALTQDPPHPDLRTSVAAMRGQVWRYAVTFVLAMLPIVLADTALDKLVELSGADRHSVPVALGESAFRQAMLFLHFSLGASIGALVFVNRFGAPSGEVATDGARDGSFESRVSGRPAFRS